MDSNLKKYATPIQWKYYLKSQELGSNRKAAKDLGLCSQTVDQAIKAIRKKAAQYGYSPENDMFHEVPNGFQVAGVSTNYDEQGNIRQQWVKSAAGKGQTDEQINEIVEALRIPKFKPVKPPKEQDSSTMNVYVFGDPHLNQYGYAKEAGHDWDVDIACDRHISAMVDMVKRSPKTDEGVLVTLGDAFHADSLRNPVTPQSGNIVDVDGRLSRVWDRGVELIRAMIDSMLKKYQKVKYICVRGNHSETLELILAKTIKIAYENEPRVEVFDNTMKHLQLTFGKNNLVFTHGDRLNDQKKANIAVSFYRKEHGAAKFTHLISGHVHHASVKEISGVFVETFQVLPTADSYHFENGYITSDHSAQVLTYHQDGGIIGRTISHPRIFLGDENL